MTTSAATSSSLVATAGARPANSAIIAVLDTNVVLDLFLFKDLRVQALHQALTARRLRWIATERMLDELALVLHRAALASWGHDSDQVMAEAQRLCHCVTGWAEPGGRVPRCTDPDDQMFIELAWRWPATLLFSRDRAVLRLARPAKPHGLWIGTPERWMVPTPTDQEKRQPKPPL